MATTWDVLAIGNLSRNRFWGESEDQPLRMAYCTTTLIRSEGLTLIVDPGYPPEQLGVILDQRAGLKLGDVDAVFVTHFHGDHRVGIDAFPKASLYLAEAEIAGWSASDLTYEERSALKRFSPAPEQFTPDVRLLPSHGHTVGHTSLQVRAGSQTVVVAGDAVMTYDFLAAREVFFNTADRAAAVEAIDRIAAEADIVVPGHDNYFVNAHSLDDRNPAQRS